MARVLAICAFVDIGAESSIAGVTIFAGAFMASKSVLAVGVKVAIVCVEKTLVLIHADETVAAEAVLTDAVVRASGVEAIRFFVAVVSIGLALVDILAACSIARVAELTLTSVRAESVETVCVSVATVSSCLALIDVYAFTRCGHSEASVADALVAANSVDTSCMRAASRCRSALVDIRASDAVSRIAGVAFAAERPFEITAFRLGVAIVQVQRAFVDILAALSVPDEAGFASAGE